MEFKNQYCIIFVTDIYNEIVEDIKPVLLPYNNDKDRKNANAVAEEMQDETKEFYGDEENGYSIRLIGFNAKDIKTYKYPESCKRDFI